MQDPKLWARIEGYDFPRGFEDKLAGQFGGWQGPMRRVREEYRRFVYLAMISDEEVTPSEVVDRVWHLHLSYTRDYWERFCPNVLQRDFHHDPCDGPESMPRYKAQYAKTMALYEQEFGVSPPLRVWPGKPLWRRFWAGLALAGVGVVVGGVALVMGGDIPNMQTHIALVLLAVGLVFAVLNTPYGSAGRTAGGCGGTAGCGGGGCGGGG